MPTIEQIRNKYKSNSKELDKIKKYYERIQNMLNYNIATMNEKGDNLARQYIIKLTSILSESLNVSSIQGNPDRDNLIEIFVDNGKGKISFHNQITLKNPDRPFTFMIRNEQDKDFLETHKGTIPNDLTPYEAAEHLILEILDFDNDYGDFKINWL
jgi:hypothetical protein